MCEWLNLDLYLGVGYSYATGLARSSKFGLYTALTSMIYSYSLSYYKKTMFLGSTSVSDESNTCVNYTYAIQLLKPPTLAGPSTEPNPATWGGPGDLFVGSFWLWNNSYIIIIMWIPKDPNDPYFRYT